MPTAPSTSMAVPEPLAPPRKRWTRSECQAVAASGILAYEHLELIDGELISKMGKNRLHANIVWFVGTWLGEIFRTQFVQTEAAIDVACADNKFNEPVPDLIVLNRPCREIATSNPKPSDLQLVVEVSDTSLRFDLTTKAALYARAEIVKYWVVDVTGRQIVVHTDPQEGRYRSVVVYSEQESVAPLTRPEALLLVGSVFAS